MAPHTLPPHYPPYTPIKRDVHLIKAHNEPFGAMFGTFENRLIVLSVAPKLTSPAVRAGLAFGDEIVHVNDRPFREFTSTELAQLLDSSSVVKLSLIESPFFRRFTLKKTRPEERLGLRISTHTGLITHVLADSPASRAGMQAGSALYFTDNQCTMGLTPTQVIRGVRATLGRAGSCTVWAGHAHVYAGLGRFCVETSLVPVCPDVQYGPVHDGVAG